MQNGTGVGRKRTQDSSSSLAVFSMNLLAFRNTVCSVSFILLSLFEELQGSMDSPQELEHFRYPVPGSRSSSLPVQACSPFGLCGCERVGQHRMVWEQKGTAEIQVLTATQGLNFGCSAPAVSLILSEPSSPSWADFQGGC